MQAGLQWGGRFSAPADAALLAFGSSLEDDLVLAPFDVRCSLAHAAALYGGGILDDAAYHELKRALDAVAKEITSGTFAPFARSSGAEDVHGAVDARVRELTPGAGALLHAGRSRNDQVATTLALYCADRCAIAAQACNAAVAVLVAAAESALEARTVLPAMTHWQPAQPVLLAFWLAAAAESLMRAGERCAHAGAKVMECMPLGSAAVCGSSLPLDREAALDVLQFDRLSPNAMDAIGSRDAALECAHALVTALVAASRICEEIVIWCNPLVNFARVGDAASTGSSLMPQKRNPDPFELVRGLAAKSMGIYCGALATTSGLALSYHRDLQQTKAAILQICEEATDALDAFARALPYVAYNADAMNAAAGKGYTVATDLADELILHGASAREAHETVGARVAACEREGVELDALTPLASVAAKKTAGSTAPGQVRAHLHELRERLSAAQ